MRQITEYDNVIDSRDVIERIDELTSQHDEYHNGEEGVEWTSEDAQELATLEALALEGERTADDWFYGATLVRASYFADYIRELLTDTDYDTVGRLPSYVVIDWEATADELRVDYSEVEFEGVTYLVR